MTYKKRLEALIADAQNEVDKAIKLQDDIAIKTATAYLNGLKKAYEILPDVYR